MNTSSSRIRGFSLIELLVVMLIIGIVAAFIVPQASTIIRGSQMSQASNIITDQFNIARQYALTKNHPVEVRLIRYADPEVPGETANGSVPANGCYRAVQILQTSIPSTPVREPDRSGIPHWISRRLLPAIDRHRFVAYGRCRTL